MAYVDGFVIPISKKNVAAYKKMATAASKIWMEHGAVSYVEAIGDDLKCGADIGVTFNKLTAAKPSETVIFAFVTYKSRKHRDAVNKKIMADPRIAKMMEGKKPPFDCKRMAYGGFASLVQK